MGHQLTFSQLVTNSTSGSAVLHECSLFNLIISLSFSFQEYLACSQGVVNRWSSRKCRFHIINLSALLNIVEDKFDISIINTKLIDNANCQDMWVRDSSLHKGLPGPDGHPSDPWALSWLSGDQLDQAWWHDETSGAQWQLDETCISSSWVLHCVRWTQAQFSRTRAPPYNSLWS